MNKEQIEQRAAMFPFLVEQLEKALDTIDACGSINMEVAREILAKAKQA